MKQENHQKTASVFASIVGRPNVGKSSLLNRLVGEKTAIVTPKPQTTRTRITGIVTKGDVQFVFLDTPGFHKARTKLGDRMDRTVKESLAEVDAVLMVFEPLKPFSETEKQLVEAIQEKAIPAIGIVNKIDTVQDANALKFWLDEIRDHEQFNKIIPASALTGEGCDQIFEQLLLYSVPGPHFFPEDSFTDMPEKQVVAEIVREKVLLFMQEEIPHGIAVEVERFHERPDKNIIDIDILIYCEKKSHKGMVIGKGGQMLKKIATAARQDCEELLGSKVHMQCWVKIKTDWRDDEKWLNRLGFKE